MKRLVLSLIVIAVTASSFSAHATEDYCPYKNMMKQKSLLRGDNTNPKFEGVVASEKVNKSGVKRSK